MAPTGTALCSMSVLEGEEAATGHFPTFGDIRWRAASDCELPFVSVERQATGDPNLTRRKETG